jgi:broad specificity phosphatase PhoE
MRKIIFVRHSITRPEPGIPPNQWELTDKGRSRCFPLADRIKKMKPDIVVTSKERKARETGQIIADILDLSCQSAENLHEHLRNPDEIFSYSVFLDRIANLFSKPDKIIFGMESAVQALERFSTAVSSVMDTLPDINPVIVSHGTVLSLYYGDITGNDPFEFWKMLGMPALYTVSWPDTVVESIIIEMPEKE